MTVLSFIVPNQWGPGRGVSNLALVVITAKVGIQAFLRFIAIPHGVSRDPDVRIPP
jgi:hypothetical protein